MTGERQPKVNTGNLDHDSRVFAAEWSVLLQRALHARGVKLRHGWDKGAPLSGEGLQEQLGRHWLDHLYTMITPMGRLWVAEPYSVEPSDVQHIMSIAGDTWDVSFSSIDALHFPGRTIAIRFQHKEAAHV